MKTWKLAFGLVLVIAASFGGLYLWQVGPLAVRVWNHENRIEIEEKRSTVLEERAGAAERRLDAHDAKLADHEKRIAELEKARAETDASLAQIRLEIDKTANRLQEVERRAATATAEREKQQAEIKQLTDLLHELFARDEEHARREKELLGRVQALEKMNDGKMQR